MELVSFHMPFVGPAEQFIPPSCRPHVQFRTAHTVHIGKQVDWVNQSFSSSLIETLLFRPGVQLETGVLEEIAQLWDWQQ